MATKDVETGPIRELVKEKSVTMEYFLESSHLDTATADMLKKYDRDGNGSFSKDEVVAIILDLREAMQSNEMLGASNKMLRKVVVAVSIFSLIMLASIFGLTFGVVALTAKLDVDSSGVMTTPDGKTHVSTDTTSYMITPSKNEETGTFCLGFDEANTLFDQATSGNSNVIVEFDGVNGTQTVIEQINGGVVNIDPETGKTCFTNAQGNEVCMRKSAGCATDQSRRLTQDLHQRLLDEDGTCSELFTRWARQQAWECLGECGDDDACKCGCIGGNYEFDV